MFSQKEQFAMTALSLQTPSHAGKATLAPRRPLSIAAIRKDLGISRERMARLLDVSSRSIQRWEENDQLPSNRWVVRVLNDIGLIVELGYLVFTPEGFRLVMTTPQPGFNNRSGLEAIEAGQPNIVLGELATLYEGAIGT